MSASAGAIKISPVNVLWRIEASEDIDYDGVFGAGLNNKYWVIYSAKDVTKYHVWHNVDAGGTDPAPASSTPIEVAILSTDNAEAVATKVATAIDAVGDFDASSSGTIVSVNRPAGTFGAVTDTIDNDSGVKISQCRSGKDEDLGLLDGDVELSLSPANFTVLAHQTGVTPRANLFQGIESLEVSTTLLQTETSDLRRIYEVYGDTFLSTSSNVTGIGTSKQGTNILVDAARLVLKPVNAINDTENTVLMLASPVPDSLVFSGENPRTLSVTWQGFVDDQIDSRASAFLLGDETQAGLRN